MSVIKALFITYLLGTLISVLQAQLNDVEGSRQSIDHPDKNEYHNAQPGTDKHRYGYELKENKHFHHTTTELDGVRLGCYGYVLVGKKYSTQYVADVRGYRPVYTYQPIVVYPKSGGQREASFLKNLDEENEKSDNLRYFFPEGCRGIEIPAEKNPMRPPVLPETKPPTRVSVISTATNPPPPPPPKTTRAPAPAPPTPSPPRPTPDPRPPPPPATKAPVVTPKAAPPSPAPPSPTPAPRPQPPATPKPTKAPPSLPNTYLPPKENPTKAPAPPTKAPAPVTKQTKSVVTKPPVETNKNDGCKECCNDDEPKIVIPIKLKNGSGKSGCSSYAKLILPADNANVNSLKSNPTELAKMVLQSI